SIIPPVVRGAYKSTARVSPDDAPCMLLAVASLPPPLNLGRHRFKINRAILRAWLGRRRRVVLEQVAEPRRADQLAGAVDVLSRALAQRLARAPGQRLEEPGQDLSGFVYCVHGLLLLR